MPKRSRLRGKFPRPGNIVLIYHSGKFTFGLLQHMQDIPRAIDPTDNDYAMLLSQRTTEFTLKTRESADPSATVTTITNACLFGRCATGK